MKKLIKIIFPIITLFSLCIALTACGYVSLFREKSDASFDSLAKSSLSPEEKADKLLSQMTDAQKIGQLIMIGIPGPTLDDNARYMMTEFPCGNVILFDRNMQSPEQTTELNKKIHETILNQSNIPPFIAIDQEGGAVVRMEKDLPPLPAAETVGQGTTENAKKLAKETGISLKSLGFNLNFAPVVDLNSLYHRSYGKTPETVIPFAKAVIDGYTEANIKTTLKHFPGIGKAKTDPHMDKEMVSISKEILNKEDGKPFRELIKQTNPNDTFIMVSNVTYPDIDLSGPACLSRIIMTDILQNEYQYKGIIFTDDTDMGAMAKYYTFTEIGCKAIEAGADIILVCHDYRHAQDVFNGLLKAYRNGTLDHQFIDQKVKKIILTKMQL